MCCVIADGARVEDLVEVVVEELGEEEADKGPVGDEVMLCLWSSVVWSRRATIAMAARTRQATTF